MDVSFTRISLICIVRALTALDRYGSIIKHADTMITRLRAESVYRRLNNSINKGVDMGVLTSSN